MALERRPGPDQHHHDPRLELNADVLITRGVVEDSEPMRRHLSLVVLAFMAVVTLWPAPASAAELPPGGTYIDDDGNVHEGSIEAISAQGVTRGCDDRQIRFCPDLVVTRGQMAAFLSRALGLPAATGNYFTDDNSSIFEDDINKIAEAGITLGCNPPANTRFCPNGPVRRDEMATFMARAFAAIVPDTAPDKFVDDNSDIHQTSINRIAAAGITLGCNPPANDLYCPRDRVTRDQMASFLARAMGLQSMKPPAQKPIERVSRFTTFFDCCQNRVTNIRLMAKAVDGYVVMPGALTRIAAGDDASRAAARRATLRPRVSLNKDHRPRRAAPGDLSLLKLN